MSPESEPPQLHLVTTKVRAVGESPALAGDHLSPGQRSTIRRAVQDAIDAHGVEWAMRNTCAELEEKYGISYDTIDHLLHDELPAALPEELLTSGQRNRIRREFSAAMSIADLNRRNGAAAEVVQRAAGLFGVSEDSIRAVVGAEGDSVPPTAPPGGLPVLVAAPSLPEPGQVVEVRGSTWAVANVQAQGLPLSPADDTAAQLNHVVDLQSLDEDRLGEQLSVIWELEVGKTVTPPQGLPEHINPEGFDDPVTLAGFIDAMRWGAVTSADPNRYQAPFWSGVTVEAYQLEPLRRALTSPRTNLLLADDVGLGKTIEAGLVVQELFLRHRARTAVIVCPPSLALKWQDEMRDKFGLQFVIVNSELMSQVRRTHGLHANPFQLYPRVIVSMAWLPQVRCQRLLRDVYAQAKNPKLGKRFAFDMLIVDEAHHVAPSSPSTVASGRGYSVDTQRTVAVRQLADTCEHRLFLSATPHNGYPESFTALMEMIDTRRFSRGALLDATALKDVTVRRLKRDLKGKGFKDRQVSILDFSPEGSEQEMFSLVDDIVTRSAKQNGTKPGGDIVTMLLKKRFLSSPFAFGMTISHYRDARAGRGLRDDDYDDIFGEGQADEEEGLWEHDEAERLRESRASDPLSAAEPGQLQTLADWGLSYEGRPDSRLERLLTFLDAVCRPDGTHWSNERVVVFTEYAHTLGWLQRVLVQRGYADRLAVIEGATPTEDREYIRSQFTADPTEEPVRVLLATDAAGEGIDLQTHCHRLVNFTGKVAYSFATYSSRCG